MPTGIPYLDEQISPLGWGCYGPGGTAEHPKRCSYCFAHRYAGRGLRDCPECRRFVPHWHPEQLEKLAHWKKPRRIGVQFMGDLWGGGVPDQHIDAVFAAAMRHREHTFVFLTKAVERMCNWLSQPFYRNMVPAFPNLWLGVTCEHQAAADERIPLLLQTPAAVHWVSLEPLWGPVTLRGYLPGTEAVFFGPQGKEIVRADKGIAWVVIGAQAGPDARPCDPAWVEAIIRQCKAADVPAWVKGKLHERFRITELPQGGHINLPPVRKGAET